MSKSDFVVFQKYGSTDGAIPNLLSPVSPELFITFTLYLGKFDTWRLMSQNRLFLFDV